MTSAETRKTCIVLGGHGFVGSAFVTHAERQGFDVIAVGRDEWTRHAGTEAELVVCAAGNAKKRLANADPARDLDASVGVVYRALRDYPCRCFMLVSTVDVYSDPGAWGHTGEDEEIELAALSTYGYHRRLAELAVQRGHDQWLVLRLAQMVGPGLKKGPLFDLVKGQPRWVAPASTHHYLSTAAVARIALALLERGIKKQTFNVVGRGSVSPERLSTLLPPELVDRPQAGDELQRYAIDTRKIEAVYRLPDSWSEAAAYVRRELASQ